ncbi:MAG: hypothetical protein ACLU5J_06925 [Christensenellales bacterium]
MKIDDGNTNFYNQWFLDSGKTTFIVDAIEKDGFAKKEELLSSNVKKVK